MDGHVIWNWQSCTFSQMRSTQAEQALLARCRAGERAAFDILLERYRDRVLNLAFQMLHVANAAEDIAQEVFVSAFTGIKRFRGEATLFTWLYRMTINHCNRRRKRNLSWLKAEQNSIDLLTDSVSPESTAICHIAVRNTLDALPQFQRVVLILREMHDLDYDEMACILNIPVGTVRSRLHNARRRFREVWEEL